MNEHEWEDLKRYLEEHGIEYETHYTYISGLYSSFAINLPRVIIEGPEVLARQKVTASVINRKEKPEEIG